MLQFKNLMYNYKIFKMKMKECREIILKIPENLEKKLNNLKMPIKETKKTKNKCKSNMMNML